MSIALSLLTIVSQFSIAIGCELKSDVGFCYVETRHAVSLQGRMDAGFLQKLQNSTNTDH